MPATLLLSCIIAHQLQIDTEKSSKSINVEFLEHTDMTTVYTVQLEFSGTFMHTIQDIYPSISVFLRKNRDIFTFGT